jgi:hypothetical protein
MDKIKFEAGFRALCVAVGYSTPKSDEQFMLKVYYRKLKEKGFNDDLWVKTINRLIDCWKPEYGVEFPSVAEVLSLSGMSVSSIAKSAHKALEWKIKNVGYDGSFVLSKDGKTEHKHYVAMEAVRRMGGWQNVASQGPYEWAKNLNRFCDIYEELFYSDNIPQKPLLGFSDLKRSEFLAEYNKNQIENNK